MAIQTELTQFLRNTLSGASEDPSLATTALIIPVGRRTSLSRARDQINASFDKIEKTFKNFIEENSDKKPLNFNPNYNIPEATKASIKKRKISQQGNLVFSILGIVIGAVGQFVAESTVEIGKTLKNLVKSTSSWMSEKAGQLKTFFKKGWALITKSYDKVANLFADGVKKTFTSSKDYLEKGLGVIVSSMEVWSEEVKKTSMHDVSPAMMTMPDAKIPESAVAKVHLSIRRYWNNMLNTVRNWLFSIFEGEQKQTNLGQGAASPAASASTDSGGGGGGSENSYSQNSVMGQFGKRGVNSANGIPVAPIGTPSSIKSDMKNFDKNYQNRVGAAMHYMQDQLIKEGIPPEQAKRAAALLVGQAMAESTLKPNASHDHGTGYGIYGARLERRTAMLDWMAKNGYAQDSLEGQSRQMAHDAMTNPAYKATRQRLLGANEQNMHQYSWEIEHNFENPKQLNNREGQTDTAFSVGPIDPKATPAPPKTNAPSSSGVGNIGNAKPMGDIAPVVPMTPLDPVNDNSESEKSPTSENVENYSTSTGKNNDWPKMSPLGEITQYTRKIP